MLGTSFPPATFIMGKGNTSALFVPRFSTSVVLARVKDHIQKSRVWGVFCPYSLCSTGCFTPLPRGTVGSETAQSKGKEYENFSMGSCSFFTLYLSNTNWKHQKFWLSHFTSEYLQERQHLNYADTFSLVYKIPSLCWSYTCNHRTKNVLSLSFKLKVTFSKVIALDNKKAINMYLILNILYRPELLCNSLLQTYITSF